MIKGWEFWESSAAHNPKVGGSNPPPATNAINNLRRRFWGAFSILSVFRPCLGRPHRC